jgi:hypothetical protein
MHQDSLEQDGLVHRGFDGESSVTLAFCWTYGVGSKRDHRLRGASQASFIRVDICLLEASDGLWNVSSNKDPFGALGTRC